MPTRLSRRSAVAAGLAAWAVPVWAQSAGTLDAAIASPRRSAANVKRDRYRHPAALLRFFGLKPDLSVLEIDPGAGYWTEILAPYLYAGGSYRVVLPAVPASAAGEVKGKAAYLARLTAAPAFARVAVTDLTQTSVMAPPGSIDLALSFRNLHNWLEDGTTAAKLAAIRDALKPGGVFGLEDHRGAPDQPQDPLAKSGYVREDYAKRLIEQAGFKFLARSEIGHNPRDTKNYPKGVWTLPPALVLGAQDRDKYLAIGESDRWTMKFARI